MTSFFSVAAVCTHPLDVTKVFVDIADRVSDLLMSIPAVCKLWDLNVYHC